MSSLASALALAAALRGAVDVGGRTEVRLRGSSFDDRPILDLEVAPTVTVGLGARTWDLTAGYAPRFILHAPVAAPDVAHAARFGASWRDRMVSLSLSQEGSWGRWSFGALTPAPDAAGPVSMGPPRLGALPAAGVLDVAFARTALLAKIAAPRRWTWSFLAEHAQGGGLGAARALVPYQSGPRGQIGVEHALSRRDRIGATFSASRSAFSTGAEGWLAQGTLSWRRALSRAAQATISGGAAWAAWRAGDDVPARAAVYPIVEAALAYRGFTGRIDAQISARVGPIVDALSGLVDERVEGAGSVSWRATRSLALQGRIGAARSTSWSGAGALGLVLFGASASYRFSDVVAIDGGVRGAVSARRGVDPMSQWVVFAGVTITAPRAAF